MLDIPPQTTEDLQAVAPLPPPCSPPKDHIVSLAPSSEEEQAPAVAATVEVALVEPEDPAAAETVALPPAPELEVDRGEAVRKADEHREKVTVQRAQEASRKRQSSELFEKLEIQKRKIAEAEEKKAAEAEDRKRKAEGPPEEEEPKDWHSCPDSPRGSSCTEGHPTPPDYKSAESDSSVFRDGRAPSGPPSAGQLSWSEDLLIHSPRNEDLPASVQAFSISTPTEALDLEQTESKELYVPPLGTVLPPVDTGEPSDTEVENPAADAVPPLLPSNSNRPTRPPPGWIHPSKRSPCNNAQPLFIVVKDSSQDCPESEAVQELREQLKASRAQATEEHQKKEQLWDEREALKAELKEKDRIAAEAKEKAEERKRIDTLARRAGAAGKERACQKRLPDLGAEPASTRGRRSCGSTSIVP